jgi:hypothetical protein
VVQKRFKFPADSVELYAEKVNNRGLCAVAQAESLRYKLLGGLAVRRCAAWPPGLAASEEGQPTNRARAARRGTTPWPAGAGGAGSTTSF